MVFSVQFAPVLDVPAPAGADSVPVADTVDFAVAQLTTLLDYVRAKEVVSPAAPFVSKGNIITTPGNATAALVANDANFGGNTSIDVSAMTAATVPFQSAQPCPSSFTFMVALRLAGQKSNTSIFAMPNHGTGIGGFYMTLSMTGSANVLANNSGDTLWTDATVLAPVNTTAFLWVSHDGPTKTTRIGKAAAPLLTHVHGAGAVGDSSTFARPLSFYSSFAGVNPNGKAEGWLLLNKAYAADSSTEDNNIASVISAWRTLVGAAN